MTLDDALAEAAIVAIIRGVKPEEAIAVGEALYSGGVRVIEVPLNSPRPFESIARLARHFAGRAVIGAGTVLTPQAVDAVAEAGGALVVTPNTDRGVIVRTLERGLVPLPGFATATEAFVALEAGATRLKLFPAATYGPGHMKAVLEVTPSGAGIMPVGGISSDSFPEWWAAGARGFGLGGDLYRAGRPVEEIHQRALKATAAVKALQT